MIIKDSKCHFLEFCAVVMFCQFLLLEISVLCVHGTQSWDCSHVLDIPMILA